MCLRIVSFLFLVLSSALLPLPVVLGVFVLFVSFFSNFWEGILAGLLMDTIYIQPALFDKFNLGFFTLSFVIAVLLIEKAKYLAQGRNFASKLIIAASGGLYFYLILLLFS